MAPGEETDHFALASRRRDGSAGGDYMQERAGAEIKTHGFPALVIAFLLTVGLHIQLSVFLFWVLCAPFVALCQVASRRLRSFERIV